jgi:hypothetical protein
MCATIPKWNVLFLFLLCVWIADPNGRAVEGVGLRPVACKDCGFESRRGHGFVSVISVVCCVVESLRGAYHLCRGVLPNAICGKPGK